jgi:prepilin-type N-terminal cleavage/methylation domain-containing protein
MKTKKYGFILLRQRLRRIKLVSLAPARTVIQTGGFTIVELLVVIVVIGILAAVTIVSFTGISNKASLASLQTDLSNTSKQLKIFQTINGNYPATVSLDCASTPDTTTNKCLKLSSGNTITSLTGDYIVNNTTNPQTFSLTIKNSSTNIISLVTNNSKPIILTPAPLSPVADWLAIPTGDHYGNFYDSVSKTYATVTRATTKTIYDPATQHIYDVPAGKLAINPRNDGKNGFEAVIEEGRTNYMINSDFETSGWSNNLASNVTGTSTVSTPTGLHGNKSQRIQYTGIPSDSNKILYFTQVIPTGNFTTGDSATLSVYIKGSFSGVNPYIDLIANQDSTYLGRAQTNTTTLNSNSFTKYTITYASLPIGTNNLEIRFGMANGIDNEDYLDLTYDAIQLEKGVFATSYIPTATTTVTRNADDVTVPTATWNASTGSWLIVASRPGNTTSGNCAHRLTWGINSLNDIQNRACPNEENTYSVNSTSYSVPAFSIVDSAIHVYGMTYVVGDKTKAYIDGTSYGQSSLNIPVTISSMPTSASVGRWLSVGAFYYNNPISRLIVYPSALSSSDVNIVTNTIKDGP